MHETRVVFSPQHYNESYTIGTRDQYDLFLFLPCLVRVAQQ